MKKLLKILLVLVISLPAIIFGNAEKNKVYAKIIGDYSYELIDDESAIILNYSGSEKNLVIPKEIGGKTVKKIGYIRKKMTRPRKDQGLAPSYTF